MLGAFVGEELESVGARLGLIDGAAVGVNVGGIDGLLLGEDDGAAVG